MTLLLDYLHMNPHVLKKFNPNRDEEGSRSNATTMIRLEWQGLNMKKALARSTETYRFLEAYQ